MHFKGYSSQSQKVLCIKCEVTPVSSTSALYSTEDDPLVDLKNLGLGRLLLILCNVVEILMVSTTSTQEPCYYFVLFHKFPYKKTLFNLAALLIG